MVNPLRIFNPVWCGGLRGVDVRNAGSAALCRDYHSGRVVLRSAYFDFWLERFTAEEIRQMARALWG